MTALLDNWLGWLGLGATAATLISLASWIPGVGIALRIFTAGLEIISPLLNGIFAALIWVWSNILFPGLRGIFSSISVTLTVIALFASYYLFDKANDAIRYRNLQRHANSCEQSVRTKKPIEPVEEEPLIGLFNIFK